MTVLLLDANVLIALIDRNHVFNRTADRWFATHHADGWATCPLAENAVLRIVGHPGYHASPGGPGIVSMLLRDLVGTPGHVFWSDHISLLDRQRVILDSRSRHGQLTDTYLLASPLRMVGCSPPSTAVSSPMPSSMDRPHCIGSRPTTRRRDAVIKSVLQGTRPATLVA